MFYRIDSQWVTKHSKRAFLSHFTWMSINRTSITFFKIRHFNNIFVFLIEIYFFCWESFRSQNYEEIFWSFKISFRFWNVRVLSVMRSDMIGLKIDCYWTKIPEKFLFRCKLKIVRKNTIMWLIFALHLPLYSFIPARILVK